MSSEDAVQIWQNPVVSFLATRRQVRQSTAAKRDTRHFYRAPRSSAPCVSPSEFSGRRFRSRCEVALSPPSQSEAFSFVGLCDVGSPAVQASAGAPITDAAPQTRAWAKLCVSMHRHQRHLLLDVFFIAAKGSPDVAGMPARSTGLRSVCSRQTAPQLFR